MEPVFQKCKKHNEFFKILPLDWHDTIISNWESYEQSGVIYVLKDNKKIIAGGIVFSENPPKPTPLELKHTHLFKQGYLYLGFIFVLEEYRQKKLASKWLLEVKNSYKKPKFWLSIEDYSLHSFYQKNGFKIIAEDSKAKDPEWLLVFDNT